MARWLVELRGERSDLEEYGRHFPSGDVSFVEEDGRFFLISPRFEALTGAEQVHEAAERLLGQHSAILSLIWPDLQPAALDAVIRENDDGGRHRAVFGKGAALIGRVKASATAVTGAPAGKPEATQAQGILAQLDDRPHLRAALAVWAETPRTWPRLYRILDEIEADLGQPVDKAGLCSRNARQRFTHSAQHPAVAGVDARHGQKKFDRPKKPMSLVEAESFSRHLLLSCATRARSASPSGRAGGLLD